MVFPLENEDRTMRNLLMLCQDHTRLVVEVFRKVLVMIDYIINNDIGKLEGSLEEIEKLQSDSLDIKWSMMKELHSSGGVLVNPEGFYRLISKSGEMMDHIKGIGIRLWQIGKKNWKIPLKIGEGLVFMADVAFETLTKLRESVISLGFNSDRAIVLAREVDDRERKVDALYRELDLEIITSENDLPIVLILRDITSMIENIVDMADEEADIIRILAL